MNESRCSGQTKLVNDQLTARIERHPCYCADAHRTHARIHLPVAPKCNLSCNYCNRKFDCMNESRPGVTSTVLDPAGAIDRLIAVRAKVDNLSVVGIAGPGDALANADETFATFALAKKLDPSLILCLSTNGLEAERYADAMAKAGLEHVTITLNAVTPETAAKVYAGAFIDGHWVRGNDAAGEIVKRQLAGISALAKRGMLVKVNTVLIPGVNENEISAITEEIKSRGAFIHNILPLMSKPEYDTAFSRAGVPEPTAEQLEKARADATAVMGGFSRVMRHCKQCRADAVGVLGTDRHAEFAETTRQTAEWAELNKQFKDEIDRLHASLMPKLAGRTIRVAVATASGLLADRHLGNSDRFAMFDITMTGIWAKGMRGVQKGCSGGGNGMGCSGTGSGGERVKEMLGDCHAVSCVRAGYHSAKKAEDAGFVLDYSGAYSPVEIAALKAAEAFCTAAEEAMRGAI